MEDQSNRNLDEDHEIFYMATDQIVVDNVTSKTALNKENQQTCFEKQPSDSTSNESNNDVELNLVIESFKEQVEDIDDSVLDTLINRNMNDPELVDSYMLDFIGLMENVNDPIYPLVANYVKCRYDLTRTIEQLEIAFSKSPKISDHTNSLITLKNVSQRHLDSSKDIFQFIDEEGFEYEVDTEEEEDQQVGLTTERIEKFEHFQADGSFADQQCQVCLDDLEVGRCMVRLDCDGKHSMCEKCAYQWFSNHNTCHVCRKVFD